MELITLIDVRGVEILRGSPKKLLLYLLVESQYRCAVLTALDQWFATEILPLEGVLTRYLNRVWPNVAEVLDLRQDIYIRVYESARKTLPTAPKAFSLPPPAIS